MGTNPGDHKTWVRRFGSLLALALVGTAVVMSLMRRSEESSARRTVEARTVPAPPPAAPELAASPSLPARTVSTVQARTAPPPPLDEWLREETLGDELRERAAEIQVPAETDGKWGRLYQTWHDEPEDAEATDRATRWLEERMLELDMIPDAAYLSCRTTLCRLGVGFERPEDVHRLRRLKLPSGVEPQVTDVYEYASGHGLVIYWTRADEG